MRPRAILGFLVLAPILGAGTGAIAGEPEVEFTVRPAHPDYADQRGVAWLLPEGDPGETIRSAVEVENLADAPIELVLYPSDGTTGETGDLVIGPEEAPREGVSAWIDLGTDQVRLDPGEKRRVRVTIRVPEDATPGDHVGAVVARTAEPAMRDDVPTHLAVGARLYLRVHGDLVHDLHAGPIRVDVRDGRARFYVPLENRGNTLLEVRGSLRVDKAPRRGLGSTDLGATLTLVPGAKVTRLIVWPDPLPAGEYQARMRLEHQEGWVESDPVIFLVPGPLALLFGVAGLALAIALFAALRRRAGRAWFVDLVAATRSVLTPQGRPLLPPR